MIKKIDYHTNLIGSQFFDIFNKLKIIIHESDCIRSAF